MAAKIRAITVITHTTILEMIHDTMMRTASGSFTYPRKSLLATISTSRNNDAGSNQSRLPFCFFSTLQHLACSLRSATRHYRLAVSWITRYALQKHTLCQVWRNDLHAQRSALFIKQEVICDRASFLKTQRPVQFVLHRKEQQSTACKCKYGPTMIMVNKQRQE